MDESRDDLARWGHICTLCWEPWWSHLRRRRSCPATARVVLSGKQQR